ncbi:MAG: hypothetical protein JSS02_13550 [Planctomycetes bacterium]|nr:hypothetical protein [Planctomycetota bacterium]
MKLRSLVTLLVACGLEIGCSQADGPACHPTYGTVTLDGSPLAEAMIVLHPLDADADNSPRPLAYANSEGYFELTTIRPGDGAPAGKYAITVELRELKPDGDEMVRDGQNLLPDRYRDPKTSGFRCTVVPGENELSPLDVKSQ